MTHQTPYSRKTLPPEYRDLDRWPSVDEDQLSPDDATRARRMRCAIEGYLNGENFTRLCVELKTNRSDVLSALNRCVRAHPDGRIYGWRALIRFTHVAPYIRSATAEFDEDGAGLSGAFSKLMSDYPRIRAGLL